MPHDPLYALDAVAWDRLHHAYGPATDVPGFLRGLRDSDPEARAEALSGLWGSVCHQGTRWQASAATVRFLAALVDDPATPDRDAVLRLLAGLVVGHRRDDELPFDPVRVFAKGATIGAAGLRRVVDWLHDPDETAEPDGALTEAAVARWEADAYWQGVELSGTVAGWVGDADDAVAAAAAALLAWFPPRQRSLSALLSVDARRATVRASANLALAHLPTGEPGVDELLSDLLGSPSDLVAVTAAVALAYRLADRLPERALYRLVDAYGRELPPGIEGWYRAPRGFVALALARLGLG